MRSDYVNFKNYIQVDPGINHLQFFFNWQHMIGWHLKRMRPLDCFAGGQNSTTPAEAKGVIKGDGRYNLKLFTRPRT